VEPEQIKNDFTHPNVTDDPENVIISIQIYNDPYTAADSTQAIEKCTKCDEFLVIFYEIIILFINYNQLISIITQYT